MPIVSEQGQTESEVMSETVRNEHGLLDLIDQHRKAALSTPFILALVLGFVYALAGNEFRRVIDFFAPGHIFGQ
jgi:hypothetical protein